MTFPGMLIRRLFPALVLLWAISAHLRPAQETVQTAEPNRGGEISLLSVDPNVALRHLIPAEGYEVNLFASEVDFPIGNPVALTFDSRGRLWVATMPTYPQVVPGIPPNDKLVILEDTDNDGRADRHTVFADDLYLPTGFELGDGGVYVGQQPNLMFLRDKDGDDVADERRVILHGFGTEDSHHALHVFTWGPGGGLYFQEGTFHHSQVETPWGPVRLVDSGVFRFEPLSFRLEVFVSYRFANPWGHVFDDWGQNFIADASNGNNYYALPFSGRLPYPDKHPPLIEFTPTKVRPTAGCEIVSSRHFPESAQGNFLINNTIGFHGTKQYRIIEKGSGFTAQEIEPLLQSTDINFRPVALQFGPDGALYIVDWFNPLVGHMQFSLRDPRRDRTHGRIWRVTHKGSPLLEPPRIEGQPPEILLDLLKTYENRTRYRVRRELRACAPERLKPALRQWIALLDPADPGYEHHLLEALWVFQQRQIVEPELLNRLLNAEDYRARAAATRVLRFWRHSLPDSLPLLAARVEDEHPRVRLEAVVALSFLEEEAAATAAARAARHLIDYYLDYGLRETLRALQPHWMPLLQTGATPAPDNPEGLRFFLDTLTTAELAQVASGRQQYEALLRRPDAEPLILQQALTGLAREEATSPTEELLRQIERLDRQGEAASASLAGLLARWNGSPPLHQFRPRLEELAAGALTDPVRTGVFAGLIVADGDAEPAWLLAQRSAPGLRAFSDAVPLLPSPELRALMYAKIRLLAEEPAAASQAGAQLPVDDGVRRSAIQALGHIPDHDRDSFRLLAGFIIDGHFRPEALKSIQLLSKESWQADRVSPLSAAVLDYASQIPEAQRNREAFSNLLEFGRALADRLPAEESATLRTALDELVILAIEIRAVPEELRFDKTDFSVQAGRPVEIHFVNPDVMPHNLLVCQQDSLEKVGLAAESMAAEADAFEKGFVPEIPEVLHATPLLVTGESFRLRFHAPAQPGSYPFVCTFPGHWYTMNGMMYVSR